MCPTLWWKLALFLGYRGFTLTKVLWTLNGCSAGRGKQTVHLTLGELFFFWGGEQLHLRYNLYNAIIHKVSSGAGGRHWLVVLQYFLCHICLCGPAVPLSGADTPESWYHLTLQSWSAFGVCHEFWAENIMPYSPVQHPTLSCFTCPLQSRTLRRLTL